MPGDRFTLRDRTQDRMGRGHAFATSDLLTGRDAAARKRARQVERPEVARARRRLEQREERIRREGSR